MVERDVEIVFCLRVTCTSAVVLINGKFQARVGMSDQDVIVAGAGFIVMKMLCQARRRKRRRWWQRAIFRRRYSESNVLNLRLENQGGFQNITRMSVSDFEKLATIIGPQIAKRDTNFRETIPINERLAVTLRFLATGDSYTSLMYLFKISKQLISVIVPEVCEALIKGLQDYIETPDSPNKWLQVAEEYEHLWNFPNCVGALDGKHIELQAPFKNGNECCNGTFSIVLLAAVSATHSFLFVNVGCQHRISDGDVMVDQCLAKKLYDGTLDLPHPKALSGQENPTPYVFVCNDAFPLKENMMKPFPGPHLKRSLKGTYNYRLSRAHSVVENTFGIMASVFRILRKPLLLQPTKARSVVLACVHLHNFLRKSDSSKNLYSPKGTFDSEDISNGDIIYGSWREETTNLRAFQSLQKTGWESTAAGYQIREQFAEYFSSVGRLPFCD